MSAQDRQKLAETVRAAFAAHYRTGSYADLGMAMQDVQNDLLAALAEPCQECETLREKLAEPNVVVPQDAALFDLLAKWKNAPSDTASAETPEGEGR